MSSVLNLTRAKWKKFKEDNNLSKSSFFNKADVGPSIASFATAYEAFEKSRGHADLLKASGKLTDLQKAFKKFIQIKEAKTELSGPAKAQIQAWDKELDIVVGLMSQMVKTYAGVKLLQANDAKAMNNRLDSMFNL